MEWSFFILLYWWSRSAFSLLIAFSLKKKKDKIIRDYQIVQGNGGLVTRHTDILVAMRGTAHASFLEINRACVCEPA
jgi:hypothetical protein